MLRSEMFATLKSNFVATVPALRGVVIEETHSLRDLGANSLVLSQAVSETIQQLGLSINREDLLSLRTLGELLDLMESASRR
jgi:acyl carrier protein